MPVYTLTAEEARPFPGFGIVNPGDSVFSQKFRWPTPEGFELTDEGSAPWVTLHADVLDATITDMAKYKEIHVTNNSGAIIEFTVNGDLTNVRALLDKETVKIEQDWEINSMSITGEGTGEVYVYGTL